MTFSTAHLLMQWVRRDFRVKYTQTALGSFWALAQPIALTATFVILMHNIAGLKAGVPYASFVLPGMLVWTLFSGGVTGGVGAMASSMFIASKAHYPRVVAPISGALLPFVDVLAGLLLLPVLFVIQGTPARFAPLPFVLALLGTLTLSIGLSSMLSAMAIFVRDVRNVLPLLLQLLLLLTPVAFPASRLPHVLGLNPMATFVEGFRSSMLPVNAPTVTEWLRSWAVAGLSLAIGIWYFHRVEHRFADVA